MSEDEDRKAGMQEEDQDEVEGHRRAVAANDDTTDSEGDDEVEAHLKKAVPKKF